MIRLICFTILLLLSVIGMGISGWMGFSFNESDSTTRVLTSSPSLSSSAEKIQSHRATKPVTYRKANLQPLTRSLLGQFQPAAEHEDVIQLAQRRFRQPVANYDVPDWKNNAEFPLDSFTFVRIEYDSWNRRGAWRTDYPDSDLNIAYRVQQLTSIKVQHQPYGKIIQLTDDELFDYPFIYICEPGSIFLSPEERHALRRYLLNGGFLMVDDFWGEDEWEGFYHEIKKVFPDREPQELPIEHPIFHCVYDLKTKPQIPSINTALYGRELGITWEREDAKEVHYRGLFDDKGRLMAMICHNTDLGDGWEREGEDHWYFQEFSEKKAYPLGINIIFYAMTH